MDAAFPPEVLTGAQRTLNLVVVPLIRCRDDGRTTYPTASPADETIKLGIARLRILDFEFRNSQSAFRNH